MSATKKYGFWDSPEDYIQELVIYGAGDEPDGFFDSVNRGIRLFHLCGTELVDFAIRCIQAYQSRRCVPCKPGYPIYVNGWVEFPGLGDTPDAIRARVIADWLASGGGLIEDWTGVWFGLPHQVTPLAEAKLAAPGMKTVLGDGL